MQQRVDQSDVPRLTQEGSPMMVVFRFVRHLIKIADVSFCGNVTGYPAVNPTTTLMIVNATTDTTSVALLVIRETSIARAKIYLRFDKGLFSSSFSFVQFNPNRQSYYFVYRENACLLVCKRIQTE